MDDATLMAQLATGDAAALGELYVRYNVMVKSLYCRLLPSLPRDQAEDLCHDVFITLHASAARYIERGRLKSWLCGIAAAKARNHRRLGWFRRTIGLEAAIEAGAARAASDASQMPRSEARLELERALGALHYNHREVLLLSVVEGLTATEIATVLGVATKTVWTRLHRARQTMRRALEDRGRPWAAGSAR